MRSRRSPSSCASPRRFPINASHSSSPRGSRRIDVAFILPPPQSGRTSRSSVRATQSRKIGASRERSATCSTRSMKTGSAHCRSSTTTTCGRSAARASSSRLNASCVSGGRRADHGVGLDPDRDQDLDERPVRDPLAVREAAAAQDVCRVADALEEVGDEARLSDSRGAEQRDEPARAGRRGRPRSRARDDCVRASVRREAPRGCERAPPTREEPRAGRTRRRAPLSL